MAQKHFFKFHTSGEWIHSTERDKGVREARSADRDEISRCIMMIESCHRGFWLVKAIRNQVEVSWHVLIDVWRLSRNSLQTWLILLPSDLIKELFRQVNYFIADMYRIHKWIEWTSINHIFFFTIKQRNKRHFTRCFMLRLLVVWTPASKIWLAIAECEQRTDGFSLVH